MITILQPETSTFLQNLTTIKRSRLEKTSVTILDNFIISLCFFITKHIHFIVRIQGKESYQKAKGC